MLLVVGSLLICPQWQGLEKTHARSQEVNPDLPHGVGDSGQGQQALRRASLISQVNEQGAGLEVE